MRQAVGETDGEAELVIDERDSGGTSMHASKFGDAAERIKVECRTLLGLLRDHGFTEICALKIDVEGTEDAVLMPFLERAPDSLLPRWLLIEDSSASWRTDVFAALRQRGYVELDRSKQNVVLARGRQGAVAA